jgi:hypothetical protein
MSGFTNLFATLQSLWQKEPARIIAVVSSAVVFAATNFGFVVQETSVTTAVTLLLTVLLSGEVIRSKVTPAKLPVKTPPTTPVA